VNRGIFQNLPPIVMHELVAKRGKVDGKGQRKDDDNTAPIGSGGVCEWRWSRGIHGWRDVALMALVRHRIDFPANSVSPYITPPCYCELNPENYGLRFLLKMSQFGVESHIFSDFKF
jgi:hypothetical protein